MEFFEKVTHRSAAGRTGRGDAIFAAYPARGMDRDPAGSLRFAAALAHQA